MIFKKLLASNKERNLKSEITAKLKEIVSLTFTYKKARNNLPVKK